MIPEDAIQEGLQVISGNPTEAELAAVIAILQASHQEQVSTAKGHSQPKVSSWNRNSTQFRNDLRPGVGQWRAQYRPGLG